MAQVVLPAGCQPGDRDHDGKVLVEPDRVPLHHILIGEPALVGEVITQIHLGRYRVDRLL